MPQKSPPSMRHGEALPKLDKAAYPTPQSMIALSFSYVEHSCVFNPFCLGPIEISGRKAMKPSACIFFLQNNGLEIRAMNNINTRRLG